MLNGMTDASPEKLARLTRSWDSPPELEVRGGGFESAGYDPAQRAYVLNRTTAKAGDPLEVHVAASEESPIENLAIVINRWNAPSARVEIDGQKSSARCGRLKTLNGDQLVVFVPLESREPRTITIRPTATSSE